ncbi:hypothetical protein [Periweissella ghanensis]|uniref:Uncharacterized protein n=1 Tax=Periweissella ghanensis TaxID=467997 RepID=A0ABM8Z965_9LACO|nr:hypothetical protein [Periweissella ghanensis]MCM0601200.1 hypothetical protein [Periweissella ghanensis]CAH0418000.1 hypothetical protein WGH24286_00416 [Periweissella ghanensis]
MQLFKYTLDWWQDRLTGITGLFFVVLLVKIGLDLITNNLHTFTWYALLFLECNVPVAGWYLVDIIKFRKHEGHQD